MVSVLARFNVIKNDYTQYLFGRVNGKRIKSRAFNPILLPLRIWPSKLSVGQMVRDQCCLVILEYPEFFNSEDIFNVICVIYNNHALKD